jgi:hypothetical protein
LAEFAGKIYLRLQLDRDKPYDWARSAGSRKMSLHPNSGLLPAGLPPRDTARYTYEMLESLRKIALKQGQALLAHLLELAALEARAQATNQAQDTRLPG